MSPGVVYSMETIAEPRSIRRRRPGDLAVVAGVDPIAPVMPVMVPAVSGLRHDESESVVQEIRSVDPEPSTPSGIANAEWEIGAVTLGTGHGLQDRSRSDRSACGNVT
jgi:hypothetical protein